MSKPNGFVAVLTFGALKQDMKISRVCSSLKSRDSAEENFLKHPLATGREEK
jgi:hypothetical protein